MRTGDSYDPIREGRAAIDMGSGRVRGWKVWGVTREQGWGLEWEGGAQDMSQQ